MKDFVLAHFTPGVLAKLQSRKSLVLPSLVMPTKVTVLNNGPIRIEGEFEILDPSGAAFGLAGRTVISLCRCGQSANKPFCDGSHARTGFNDPVAARELPPPKPKL